jgi:hydroxymethylpyrimidine pyrophosphatase-like HAD family hydrolase
MKIYVDIDGTICNTVEGRYDTASPIPENIKKINRLHEQGHHITYYSARGQRSQTDYTALTLSQLKTWGCKFDNIVMNHKPDYDLMICDKTKRIEEI